MKKNPFYQKDPDKYALWNMLVNRDISAFVRQDWDMVKDDFLEEEFMGIDAGKFTNVDHWNLAFPDLESYKDVWLNHAKQLGSTNLDEDLEEALHRITVLQDIEIKNDTALLHKKFYGEIKTREGNNIATDWQTLYRCKKVNDQWKIVGFTGYMPLFNETTNPTPGIGKRMPAGASQHVTAGPYAPVLVVDPGKLVVISGQASIDRQGNVIGDTIEEQTVYTLDNCSNQLASAGCTLQDVFKVNVYIKDLNEWPRFNAIYKDYFQEPRPVRTAVQTGLLMSLLVEVELWAVKK